MPIDPRIALGVQPMQLESPVNQMAKVYALQNAAQENQLGQAKLAEYQRQIEDRNALRSTLAGFTPGMSTEAQVSALQRGGHLAEARSLAESKAKVSADERAAEKSALDAEAKRLEIRGQAYGSVAANPTVENARSVLDYLLNNRLVDENGAAQAWKQIQANPTPDNIRSMAQQFQMMSVNAKDQLKVHLADLGGTVQPVSELTGKPVGEALKKTATPGELLTDKRLREKGISAAEHPLLNQAILDGRVPISRVNSRTAAIFESALQVDPKADLTALNVEQLGASAGARTAGTTKANIGIASDEANRMIGVARTIIPNVNLSDYPSLNAIQNAVSKGTGDVNIVKLNTALNSLINSYARAINPRGAATVSDKNHAREIINSAMSKGQLGGALEVMQQEMEAALGAATTATKARGKAGEEASAAKPGTKKTASGVLYTIED